MAKQVSVSPTALTVKNYTFLWTIDNFSQLSNNGMSTRLTPEDVANVKKMDWCLNVKLLLKSGKYLYINFDILRMNICPTIKVFLVNTKKENLKIYEKHWLTNNPDGWYTTDDLVTKEFLSHKESGFVKQDKLTFMFEVYSVVESEDYELQSDSAVVSLQDSPNHLRSAFTQLFDTKQCSDVTLNVGGSTVKAHKAVLIARSPVFAAMFQHDMQERQLHSVTIKDISPEVLEGMLRYMYTDHVTNFDTMAEHLLAAAEKYEILSLKLKCEEFLLANISIENAAYTLMLADRFNAVTLKAKTLDYITANGRDVMETESWKEMVKSGSNVHLLDAVFRELYNIILTTD